MRQSDKDSGDKICEEDDRRVERDDKGLNSGGGISDETNKEVEGVHKRLNEWKLGIAVPFRVGVSNREQ